MLDPHDPLVQLKITCATCSLLAISTTLHRLWIRRGRYWADDAWAAFALLTLLIQIAAVFLHIPIPNSLPRASRVAAYYLMAMTFYTVIWCSRLAILFSIVRIDPSERRRKRLYWVAVVFVVATVILLAQLLWVCQPDQQWMDAPNPQCPLPRQVAICQIVSDVIADSILLIAPLSLLRDLGDKVLRRKLQIIFSTCLVTTIVSLVHAAFIINRAGIKVVISALVEDCFSLVVANVPVVITQLVKLSGEQDHIEVYQASSLRFKSRKSIKQHTGTSTVTDTDTFSTERAFPLVSVAHDQSHTASGSLQGQKSLPTLNWSRSEAPKRHRKGEDTDAPTDEDGPYHVGLKLEA